MFLSPDVYLSFISIFPVSHVTDSYLSQLSVLQILENSVGATWVEWNLEKKTEFMSTAYVPGDIWEGVE